MISDGPWRLRALWRDDPTTAALTIDLALSGGRVASRHDLFGAFDLDGVSPRPFILRRDGRIDFGGHACYSWRTDLRDTEIFINGDFRVFFNDQDNGLYRIVKLARPGTREIE